MTTAQRLYTVDEFATLTDPPDGGKMELVDGRVIVMSPVGRRHGKLALALGTIIAEFVDSHALGEVAVETGFRLFSERRVVRAPDVSYVEVARLRDVDDDGFIDGPPTLAVEVMSPEDRDAEVSAKVQEYLQAGTQRVWVVRPNTKSVTVHRPDGSAQTYTGDSVLTSADAGFALDGFSLKLTDLFA